ncbi:metal-dependent hydrolase [Natronolimnohabitans innermongolicus]|uniref:Membrane-bound metal-dependent hydrolase n=1 Tax=Natronolimnohabitans innermongolicus JCM 12255 TaxID=1227499 RepID=L9XE03_9EURY|nr:metal-dependent hydrolase [Natronolimnohabitans innermongolicus]ELY59949.1 membrane-bound metal-dependent hydrolase [Natronolimnohabitans innermongolicus JCM 12255]
MQPVVHLAVGYLCYAAYTRWRGGTAPADLPALVAVFAAGLADFIDKPLYAAGVVPVGRTIGHSLLFAVPLIAVVWLLAARRDRRVLGVAFAIGYGSHIATDIPWHVISGDFDELGFLLWPITEMPAYTGVKPLGTVAGVEVTTLWLEAVILVAGVALWWADGRPGVDAIRRALRG